MLVWYRDDELLIEFDNKPKVAIKQILPSDDDKVKKAKANKPYINKQDLFVHINHQNINYSFTIQKGFDWNGADIKKFLWRLIGSRYNPEFLVPSLIHDYMCINKNVINRDRLLSSKVFRALLIEAGVGKFKANIMFYAVDIWQRIFADW